MRDEISPEIWWYNNIWWRQKNLMNFVELSFIFNMLRDYDWVDQLSIDSSVIKLAITSLLFSYKFVIIKLSISISLEKGKC